MPDLQTEIQAVLSNLVSYKFNPNFSATFRQKLKDALLEQGYGYQKVRGFYRLEQNNPSLSTPIPVPQSQSEPSQPILHGVKVSDHIPDAAGIWERAKKANEVDKKLEQSKENQLIEFGNEPVAIAILSDQHIGAHGTDYTAMEHDARVIAQTDGFYAVLTGDGINNFIVSKLVAARVSDALRIDEQWLALEHYFKFFEDKHGVSRIIAAVSGNHEQWTYKIAGFDQLKNILPKQILYDTDQLITTIKVGGFSKRWMFRHKTRCNSMYNALHGVKQTVRLGSSDVDVIVAAHIHRGAVFETFYFQDRKRLGILTGTYKTNDSYARQEGFVGGGLGNCVCVVITPDGRIIPFDDVVSAANHLEMERMKHRIGGIR